MKVGFLWWISLCWFGQKTILAAIDTLQRHWMLRYKIFKDDLFFIHHDVSKIRWTPLLKTQQFFTATVVRKSLVPLR